MARKHVVVKKKVVRKKKAAPSPSASPARPYAHRPYQPKPGLPGSGLGFGSIIMLLIAVALVGFIVFIFLPKDLSHVQGYPYDPSISPEQPRNLLREVQDALVAKGMAEDASTVTGSMTFTEEELNQYLQKRINYNQGGPFSSFVEMEGVYVDLEEDEVTTYIVRDLFGLPFTIDLSMQVFQSDGKMIRKSTGSSIGRLHFDSLFGAIKPPFIRLAQILNAENAELRLLEDPDIKRIKIGKDQLTLEY